MRTPRIAFFCLLITVACLAQDTPPIEYQPQYWVAAGAGWNHYSGKQANGWLTFGMRNGDASYLYTTIVMTSESSTICGGYARILAARDGFVLMGLADGGVASGMGSVGGAFSGGGSLAYDISRWTGIPRTYAVATVKVSQSTVSSGGVQPVFSFGVSKSF